MFERATWMKCVKMVLSRNRISRLHGQTKIGNCLQHNAETLSAHGLEGTMPHSLGKKALHERKRDHPSAFGPSPRRIEQRENKTEQNLKFRVAIVDDDEVMRVFVKNTLERTGEFTCVGSFSNGSEALTAIPPLVPDLVLMDLCMPELDGIECARELKDVLPEIKVVILTEWEDARAIQESSLAGASAYLLKPVTAAQCLATVRFTVRKIQPTLLTQREMEVMRCLAQGLLYKEIAEKLGLSYSAVHKHQHRIFLKLGVTNRSEAIRAWLRIQCD